VDVTTEGTDGNEMSQMLDKLNDKYGKSHRSASWIRHLRPEHDQSQPEIKDEGENPPK
jgi:hypothetical protein